MIFNSRKSKKWKTKEKRREANRPQVIVWITSEKSKQKNKHVVILLGNRANKTKQTKRLRANRPPVTCGSLAEKIKTKPRGYFAWKQSQSENNNKPSALRQNGLKYWFGVLPA